MSRVVHFEIPSDNPEKSADFYKTVFGWQTQKWGDMDYWLATTGDNTQPGINGAIMKKRDPRQPVTNSIGVKDIDAVMKGIEANGGKMVVPKTPIPTVGYYAYFTDPDGNIMGIMSEDKSAK
jgi:predicted enzyme related to lactoylglutathione lyase